ncbi:hypothetical protein [Salinimicrobium gaetbulicola]|uniref:Adhesin n=1 Tax=Salinimicrobium gaetbulicola TaxID=999702 RepID=A0ABW3IHF7_9FLAO
MKTLLFLLTLFTATLASGQKETMQVMDAGSLKAISINSEEIYRVSISTAPVHSITIRSRSDGEYFNEISLDSEIRNNTLYLKSRFREILQSGFDKLSAHKVFAMEVELEIPEDMSVEIISNLASVFLEGEYDGVLIQLRAGSAYLKNFDGDAIINTFDGNIEVQANNAQYEVETRHGNVVLPDLANGSNFLKLTSINGNIKVQETK